MVKTLTEIPYTMKTQNKAIAKDAALTGLPTLDPNDEPTKAQRLQWQREYAKAQDGALKIVKAVNGLKETKAQTSQRDTPKFEWSNRNFVDGWWKTFYYTPGAGFDTGNKVYYGRNDWRTEAQAIAAQEVWEALRASPLSINGAASNLNISATNTATT